MNEVAVLLGYKNAPDGELHAIARQRADKAVEVLRTNSCPVICTGGFGKNFNQSPLAHAIHLQSWLVTKGIATSRFLAPSLSRNTYEDGKLTSATLAGYGVAKIHLITSDFHMQRGYLWLKLFMPEVAVSCYPAETKTTLSALRALLQHEQQAIKNFYRDFPDFPSLETLENWQQYNLPENH